MQLIDRGEPGTIILVTGSLGRYGAFEESLGNLIVPVGTRLLRMKGPGPAQSQNKGLRMRTGKWIWFIDDDHTFSPDILIRLLERDKEVIAPMVPARLPPFNLVLYNSLDLVTEGDKIVGYKETFYKAEDLNHLSGVIEVQGLPKAGCLIRESLWARMPDPWFRVGVFQPDDVQDDKYFMWEIREKYGARLYCDLDQNMGHISSFAIECKRDEQGKYDIRWRVV